MTGRQGRRWLWPTIAAGGAVILLAGVTWFAAPSRLPRPDPNGLSLPDFFEGTSVSKGTVTTAWVFTEAFTAEFEGRRTGDRFQLDERFTFHDGERLQRWDLVRTGPGLYGGTVATELKTGKLGPPMPVVGVQTKNGAVLDYDGHAPGGGGTLLHFRHEMTGRPDGTIANHVIVSKFAIPLATSDVTFAKSRAELAPYRTGNTGSFPTAARPAMTGEPDLPQIKKTKDNRYEVSRPGQGLYPLR